MQDLLYPQHYSQEESESPVALKSLSQMNLKICQFSPSKISELSENEEETSSIFKQSPIKKIHLFKQFSNLDSEQDSNFSSPNRMLIKQLVELKDQILNLKQKFSYHQEEVGELVGENLTLKNKIIQLQENLLNASEVTVQNKARCNCILF
jgi:predicted RNase H-like nuclease (RuvC/YqgF family)